MFFSPPPRWFLYAAVLLGSLVLMSGLYAYGAYQLRSTINEAREEAREARDQFWRAAIAESNAKVEAERAAQAVRVLAVEQTAREQIERLQAQLTEMERLNAALPGGDQCGIDADRLRLLPR